MGQKRNLILVRHGQSEWNKKNLFTGWKNPGLTPLGYEEADNAGVAIKKTEIVFDVMFTSDLKRAQITGTNILKQINQEDLVTIKNQALNERDYGSLSGLNKDDAREKWGEEQVHIWRRSYDTPPPDGESLKNTAERVLPYFNDLIMPEILLGKNVLIAAHGNSLRALHACEMHWVENWFLFSKASDCLRKPNTEVQDDRTPPLLKMVLW